MRVSTALPLIGFAHQVGRMIAVYQRTRLLGDDDRGCLLPRCDLGFDFLGGQIAYYGMRAELQNVDPRVAKIESTLQQVANVLVLSARQIIDTITFQMTRRAGLTRIRMCTGA